MNPAAMKNERSTPSVLQEMEAILNVLRGILAELGEDIEEVAA